MILDVVAMLERPSRMCFCVSGYGSRRVPSDIQAGRQMQGPNKYLNRSWANTNVHTQRQKSLGHP